MKKEVAESLALCPNNTVDKWLCIADSSFDKDVIEAALAV